MEVTYVNIKLNVPVYDKFRVELVEIIVKVMAVHYDKNIQGWYYVDVCNWTIHHAFINDNLSPNWIDVEFFVDTYGSDFSGKLNTQDKIDILEDYFSTKFNVYDNWLAESYDKEYEDELGENWESDPNVQENIVEWYQKVYSKEWEEIEIQQEQLRKEFILDNLHEQINLDIEAVLVLEKGSVLSNIDIEDRISFS